MAWGGQSIKHGIAANKAWLSRGKGKSQKKGVQYVRAPNGVVFKKVPIEQWEKDDDGFIIKEKKNHKR